MPINIANPVQQTLFFGMALAAAIVFLPHRRKTGNPFSIQATQEMKGIGILLAIFSHIGYFLAADHRFLFPISTMGGVGVDIFLFLSGFGLTMSALANGYSLKEFYQKRLSKLYIPLWIMLAIFLAADAILLGLHWPWQFIGQAIVGLFTSANISQDFNSPCWYFTLIILYYLLFPLLFNRKWPWITAILLYILVAALAAATIPPLESVLSFWKLHTIAFPLGIAVAWLCNRPAFPEEYSLPNVLALYWPAMALGVGAIIYFLLTPNLGPNPLVMQITSLGAMMAIIAVVLVKRFQTTAFMAFGMYSYEIYLLHWPILQRYDILYPSLPAWLATTTYLGLFLGLGYGLHKLSHISASPLDIFYKKR